MALALCCDQGEKLLPGYALRALGLAETTTVAAHLRSCGRCRAALVAYQAELDRLGQAVMPPAPPPDLRERLQVTVMAEDRALPRPTLCEV